MFKTTPLSSSSRVKIRNALAAAGMALLAVPTLLATTTANADEFEHRGHVIDVHRGVPHGYRHVVVPRDRFYRGFHIVRFYGPLYPGFGFFYDDAAAWAFLGFTSWELANYNMLQEEQLRAHEAAMVEAASAPINDPITWNDGNASGSVTAVREGHTAGGQTCREFQQTVTIAGQPQQSYGTACMQPDGSWKIVQS